MDPMRSFEEVHVVSDLHLGGTPSGRQIFDQGQTLARYVDHLAEDTTRTDVALVVNGDLVDFLAEPGATYFDPVGALGKLDRIVQDDSFKPVFQALTRFASTPGRYLAITLGNHDLELALPSVHERLLQVLSGGDDDARGRITTAFDGTGFRCRVGDRTVLCLHGNEVDPFNVTDYEQLRKIRRDLSFGHPAPQWIPNGGSRMVIDVMNDIKAKFAFVDLLKPETTGVVRVLFALEPTRAVAANLGKAVPAFLHTARSGAALALNLLGEEGAGAGGKEVPPMQALERLLLEDASAAGPSTTGKGDLFDEVEDRFADGQDALELAGSEDQKLGAGRALFDWIAGRSKVEVLREALEVLNQDQSFALDHPDGVFGQLDEQVSEDVDFLLTGHTHMERAIARGRGAYYNSGTWVRLIQLTADMLASEESFKPVYDAFAGGDMARLDREEGLVLRRPAVIAIRNEDGDVKAELRRVANTGKELYQVVEGSRFPEDLAHG